MLTKELILERFEYIDGTTWRQYFKEEILNDPLTNKS
jgi:hypothetical protein